MNKVDAYIERMDEVKKLNIYDRKYREFLLELDYGHLISVNPNDIEEETVEDEEPRIIDGKEYVRVQRMVVMP